MNKLTFLLVLVFFTTLSFGQNKESILFDSDSYRLTPFQTEKINVLLNQREGDGCSVAISGHTDSDADDDYNLQLSQNRVKAVKAFITTHFSEVDIEDEAYYGEHKPIADNNNDQSKAFNRRVEITLHCNNGETEGNVWPILTQIQPKPTDLHFDGAKGGVFDLKNGAHISIAPKTFPDGQINLKVSECVTIGDAFAYGLTTQSNRTGDGLQSSGMYRVEAFQNGALIPNLKYNEIVIYVPVDQEDYQTFDATDEGKYTEWNARPKSEDKFIKPYQSLCELTSCTIETAAKGMSRFVNCKFFWCKIKSFFSRSYKKDRDAYVLSTLKRNPNFDAMYNVYKTGLDKEFKNETGFAKFVANNSYDDILAKMNELFPRFTNDVFYAMQIPSYSWVNCDRFTNYSNLTTVTIPEKVTEGKDIRLYFKKLNCVMRPNGQSLNKSAKFNRIPVGKIATLVILKSVNDVLMMSSEDFKVGDKPKIHFKPVHSADLKGVFDEN